MISKREPPISIAIPSSLVSDVPHLREKTARIGQIARAASIFRVDEIIVYKDRPDKDQKKERRLISAILSYMETPQYLRRRVFPLSPLLKYVGVLPPLRTPHHPLIKKIRHLKDGELRDGIIIHSDGRRSLIDIGVERPISLNEVLPIGMRVTVKVSKKAMRIKARKIEKSCNRTYWGYHVTAENKGLREIIRRGEFDLIIMTSRQGRLISEVTREIKELWRKSYSVIIAFGSPTKGLGEILGEEESMIAQANELSNAHALTVNTIPAQGTETVRTEEALFATLAIMNALI